jgi:hypothetical protein
LSIRCVRMTQKYYGGYSQKFRQAVEFTQAISPKSIGRGSLRSVT